MLKYGPGYNQQHNKLRHHEINAFSKISKYYKCDITILETNIGKTPDIIIGKFGIWEVKSPKGNSAHTIENSFKQAKKQSRNIIIDLSRCGLRSDVAIRKIKSYASIKHRYIRHIKVLTKGGKVIDIL